MELYQARHVPGGDLRMKAYTSEAAKSLITIIGTEYAMGQFRVDLGFVSQDRMLGTVLERLNRLSSQNANLRGFLNHGGFIPREEDESSDVHWAKDPRDPMEHRVDNRLKDSGKAISTG